MLIGILILIAIVAVPAAVIAWLTRAQSKRGCGRGCSTCANFPLCHGTGAYSHVEEPPQPPQQQQR